MPICVPCQDFIQAVPPEDLTVDGYRIARTVTSITVQHFNCRICTAIWTVLHSRRWVGSDIPQVVYLSLSKVAPGQLVLRADTKGKGGTWVLNGVYHKVEPDNIPDFLKKHGYNENPKKYQVDNICYFHLTAEIPEAPATKDPPDGASSLKGSDDGKETGQPLLGWQSQPVEFFQKFLPQLKQWLEVCDREHPTCRQRRASRALPTRLVYVGQKSGEARLRLREQVAPASPYLTLSYRWGQNFTCLKKANISEWLDRIPEDSLPRTIKESIEACRLLGFEYIWIDALCIIQDDHTDWIHESAAMTAVYSGSHLNLAASGATDVQGGLFQRCNALLSDIKPLTIRLTDGMVYTQTKAKNLDHENSSSSDWLDRRRAEYDPFVHEFDAAPLHRRGWVLQELYLSCRTVHFLETAFWWQCKERVTFGFPKTNQNIHHDKKWYLPKWVFSEADWISRMDEPSPKLAKASPPRDLRVLTLCWLCFLAYGLYTSLSKRNWIAAILILPALVGAVVSLASSRPVRQVPDNDLIHEWMELADRYIKTHLTVPSDRPIALAGLARGFADSFRRSGGKVEYHAGLWSQNLLLELLWTNWDGTWNLEGKRCSPSWSWMHAQSDYRPDKDHYESLKRFKMSYKHNMADVAQILDVETVPLDKANPFGAVAYGRIRLSAAFFTAKVSFDEWSWRRESVPNVELHVDVAYKVACPDVAMTITELDRASGAKSMECGDSDEPFYFAIVAFGEAFPPPPKYHGLILQRAPAGYSMTPPPPAAGKGPAPEYWVRRGTWEERIARDTLEPDERATRKLISDAVADKKNRRIFEII